jgi:hypothetical protein
MTKPVYLDSDDACMGFKKEADRELSSVNPATEAQKSFGGISAQLPHTLLFNYFTLKKCEIGARFPCKR